MATPSPDPSAQPDGAPAIGDALLDFHRRGALLFGIPAHRAGDGGVELDAERWAGTGAFRADVGMDKGVDARDQHWHVEATAMDRFAAAVGADETLFATGGSSSSVHVALMAALHPGEKVVVARNAHKSMFAALVLCGAQPRYVRPVYDARWELAHGVDPADLTRVLSGAPEARAVVLTTPSYYGVGSDVATIADLAHERGLPLITDDAWGLDFSFCSRLPRSALHSGSDLAIGSVHKSLSGLQQTSVISRRGTRIDPERLRLVFQLDQSTSASSLLLSSIDAARSQFERDGERLLGYALDLAEVLRARIRDLPGLDLMEPPVGTPGVHAFDPTHVTFDVTELGLTGYAADDWLREHHRVHMELSDHRRLMAVVTYADTPERIGRLAAALEDLARHHEHAAPIARTAISDPNDLVLEAALTPRAAFLGPTELVPRSRAAGRVSAEMVCPYPPGVPVVAPGERLTAEVIGYLATVVGDGGIVEGAADPSLERLRVVAEPARPARKPRAAATTPPTTSST